MKFPFGRWLAVAALAFTAYAAALLFLHEGQLAQAWSLLLSPTGLLAALLCLASYVLRGLRWRAWMVLQDRPLALLQGLRYYLAGYAFTPTPGNLGEAARGMLMVHQPLPLGQSAAVFGAERLADFLCLLLLALPAAWWLLPMASSGWRTALAVTLGSCLIATAFAVRMAGRSGHLRAMVVQRLPWLHAAWICLAHRPAHWFILTFAAWSLQGLAVWLLCDLARVSASPLQASASYALAMVGGALSMLPAGLGGTEALFLAQWLAQGADLGATVLLTVLARLLTLWFAVALGLACLFYSLLICKDLRLQT